MSVTRFRSYLALALVLFAADGATARAEPTSRPPMALTTNALVRLAARNGSALEQQLLRFSMMRRAAHAGFLPAGAREVFRYDLAGAPADARFPIGLTSFGRALFGVSVFGGVNDGGSIFELSPTLTGYRERVLYSFPAGPFPSSGLSVDARGALYGTTFNGGGTGCSGSGCGTVYKLIPTSSGYVEQTLYAFRGDQDGEFPDANLLLDSAGAVYGVAGGGLISDTNPFGNGIRL